MSKMDRRDFMQGTVAGAAGLTVVSTTASAKGSQSSAEPTAATGVDCKVDVLVVGADVW